jgi:CheY-like chemotaxis protein
MGKKILLADDSITIQKVIELTFSDEDFEVVTVGNGRLAIERVQEVRPDVVLCDIIMPEKDGYEVCDFIKKNATLSHIPVLLLTGAFEPFDQERAGRVGCDGFLAKPFEPQTLIAKVKDLLKQAESRPSAAGTAPAPAPSPAAATPFSVIPPVAAPPAPEATALDDEPFFAEAESEPESMAPPIPFPGAPSAAPPPPPGPEPEVHFIPEDPYESVEPATPPPVAAPSFDDYEPTFEPEPMPLPEPEAEPEPRAEPLPEPIPAPPVAAAPAAPPPELEPMSFEPDAYTPLEEAEEEGGEELLPMTPEEEATLAQTISPPTIEVPLEERAQASVEAAQEAAEEPFFEEVFEAEPEPPAVYVPPVLPPAASPPPVPMPSLSAPEPEPERVAPPETAASPYELEQTLVEDAETVLEGVHAMASAHAAQSSPPSGKPAEPSPSESFQDLMPAEPKAPPAPASHAAEIPIPVDMVSQIAQRVVGQLSEKVIREIAWEVIPDLAEALIKREIERIKAEMQR